MKKYIKQSLAYKRLTRVAIITVSLWMKCTKDPVLNLGKFRVLLPSDDFNSHTTLYLNLSLNKIDWKLNFLLPTGQGWSYIKQMSSKPDWHNWSPSDRTSYVKYPFLLSPASYSSSSKYTTYGFQFTNPSD